MATKWSTQILLLPKLTLSRNGSMWTNAFILSNCAWMRRQESERNFINTSQRPAKNKENTGSLRKRKEREKDP